jgi:hypothetical protein
MEPSVASTAVPPLAQRLKLADSNALTQKKSMDGRPARSGQSAVKQLLEYKLLKYSAMLWGSFMAQGSGGQSANKVMLNGT